MSRELAAAALFLLLPAAAASAGPRDAGEREAARARAALAAAEAAREAAAETFSPTTTVRTQVSTVTGGLAYEGNAVDAGANTAAGFPLLNAITFNHDTRLTIDTSFSGQDLLRLRLRSGNFGSSGFFSNPPTPLTRLDVAFQEPLCPAGGGGCTGSTVSVNRAYLQVPIGPEVRLSLGARIMQVDMLPVWPSVYTSSPILELFQRSGAAGAYNRRVGSGFGAWWQPAGRLRGLSLAYATVAAQGNDGSPANGGLFTAGGGQTSTVQLAFTRATWNLSLAYSLNGQQALLRGTPMASQLAAGARDGAINSWSLAGYWQPRRGGWLPSISAGWGYDRFAFARYPVAGLSGVSTSSWSVGLVWADVLSPGNTLSLAVGAPAHVTRLEGLADASRINDSGLAFELASLILLSDQLSLTPALFWLNRPRGAMGASADLNQALLAPAGNAGTSLGVWGALLRTTLRF